MKENVLINDSLSLLEKIEEEPELNDSVRVSPDEVLVEYLAKHGINVLVNIKHMKKHIDDYNLVFEIIKTVRDYEAKKAAERGEILMYDHEHNLFHNQKTGENFTVEDIAIGEKLKK